MLKTIVLLLAAALTPGQSGSNATPTPPVQGSPPPVSSANDSATINAVFKATGGSVTAAGSFTAGPNAGVFRIIAASGRVADTSAVTVAATPGKPSPAMSDSPDVAAVVGGEGIPFGPFGAWGGSGPRPGTEPFTLVVGSIRAAALIDRIREARARGLRLLTNMTGGAHANYKTDGVFDPLKWEARMNTYNTPAIKAAVAEAVADGTLIGNIIMDEPANTFRENSWGPPGTMTKARVDAMAVYAKSIFPTLPMGVTLDYRIWKDQSFRVIDFQVSQYRQSKGSVTRYRDGALALAARDGHTIVFSMNILDGGKPGPDCPIPETGGPGTYPPNCRMTPEQVLAYGRTLGPAGCAFLMWRHDPAFMTKTENRQAFAELATTLARQPRKSCRRS